jgi:two-component system response regulator YesN
LSYLDQHYTETGLSLKQTANAMGRNEKNLAHLFVQQIGQRMHAYITALRVRRSCELLLQTTQTIEQITLCSGFAHVAQLRQSFRRVVGVTPAEYRTIFAAGT